jgi:hypothetical protein
VLESPVAGLVRRVSVGQVKFDIFYMTQECAPRAFCMTLHSGLEEQRPQLGASCGRWQSTASICQLFSRQTTTFHPAPRHHLTELEAMSLLMQDWPRLFFQPRSKCLSTDTEHAGNTSHAGAFMIRTEYFFLLLFALAWAKMQHRTFIAVFAPILLLTLSVMSVFHDVHAVTAAASTGDDFLCHCTILTHHF